jgi:hypothetical protein
MTVTSTMTLWYGFFCDYREVVDNDRLPLAPVYRFRGQDEPEQYMDAEELAELLPDKIRGQVTVHRLRDESGDATIGLSVVHATCRDQPLSSAELTFSVDDIPHNAQGLIDEAVSALFAEPSTCELGIFCVKDVGF